MKWQESLWKDSITNVEYYEPQGITTYGKIQSKFWQCKNCQSFLTHPLNFYKITSRIKPILEVAESTGVIKYQKVIQEKNLCQTCLKKLSKFNKIKLLEKIVKPTQVFHENKIEEKLTI